MGVWNLDKVEEHINNAAFTSTREAHNLAEWIWMEGMNFKMNDSPDINESEEGRLKGYLHRLSQGEPVQYIVGHAWFYGMKLKVTPDVLIPRPETEELVEWVIEDHKRNSGLRILDIGTGSGCISIALKNYFGSRAHLVATDISLPALHIAAENARLLRAKIEFIQHDFLSESLHVLGEFDIIISNPPYISRSLVDEEILSGLAYEPDQALFPPDEDPERFYRRMSQTLVGHLYPGGTCYLEINEFRASEVTQLFETDKWYKVDIRRDLQGQKRMLKAQKRPEVAEV